MLQVDRSVWTLAFALCAITIGTNGVACAKDTKITIEVLNQKNEGVAAAILRRGDTLPFVKTANGKLEVEYKCAVGQMFKANPDDRAAYFDSEWEICANRVVLRVPSRLTAEGPAVTFKIVDLTDKDGTKYFAVVKGGYKKQIKDIGGIDWPLLGDPNTTGGARCSLSIEPSVSGEVYKPGADDKWQLVGKFDDSHNDYLASTKFIFANDCNAAKSQIFTAEQKAVSTITEGVERYSDENRGDHILTMMKPYD